MKRYLAAFVLLAGASGLASAQTTTTRRLDYARTVRQSSMVFIPYQGLGQRGPVYFTQYQEEVLRTSKVGDLRRLYVNLTPVAFRDGSYQTFVSQQGILDDKTFPVSATTACHPSAALTTLLSGMPDGYRPSVLPGNWPFFCALSVWFLPEDEQTVRDTITASHGITLSASVPLCASSSPQVNSPAILQQLISRGDLRSASSTKVIGPVWDILYDSVALSLEHPELFGTSDPREGWNAWISGFQFNAGDGTLTLEGPAVEYPVYVCQPETLELAY